MVQLYRIFCNSNEFQRVCVNLCAVFTSLGVIFFSTCQQKYQPHLTNSIEWVKYRDSLTQHEVWQITAHDSPSVAVYFERQAFTKDDKYMVFSSKRSGDWQLYRADMTTGEIVVISEKQGIHPYRFTIHPDGEHIWYVYNQVLYKNSVALLDEQVVFDFHNTFSQSIGFSSSFTADARYTLITTESDSGPSIYRVNLETGAIEHVITWTIESLSHPLICPTNPDLITFVPNPDTQNDMTLPMEKRARTWIVNMQTKEVKQFLTMPYGFRATHETWSWDGQRFFFFKKTQPGWIPVSICSIDQNGDNLQEYYVHPEIRLGHGISTIDRKWFVTDGQDPHHNPLILINLENGMAKYICWPDASIIEGHPKFAHVHPSISMSGRFLCYTSDRTGTPQVYVVPITNSDTR
ncbi:PD40 domain-containing protein [candidate division KSB1 bacterium]|nr:PD40 domain-containing protein [candidate division KSB1 bacterium]